MSIILNIHSLDGINIFPAAHQAHQSTHTESVLSLCSHSILIRSIGATFIFANFSNWFSKGIKKLKKVNL